MKDDSISRKTVINGLDYIITEFNKLIEEDPLNDEYQHTKKQVEEIKRGVLKLPPEDVKPVVRCSECEHWDKGICYCDDYEIHCQDYYVGDMHTEPDFFCGFGKRKGADNVPDE